MKRSKPAISKETGRDRPPGAGATSERSARLDHSQPRSRPPRRDSRAGAKGKGSPRRLALIARLKTIEYQSAIAPQTKLKKQLYLMGKQFGKSWTGSFALKNIPFDGNFRVQVTLLSVGQRTVWEPPVARRLPMSTIPYLPGYILSGIIAAFVAPSFFDSRPVPADQFSLQRMQAEGTARSSGGTTTDVNRARKSDRLPVLSGTDAVTAASTANTTVVRKNAASPALAKGAHGTPAQQKAFEIEDAMPTPKPTPAPLVGCEAVASPFADPALGHIIGRCVV